MAFGRYRLRRVHMVILLCALASACGSGGGPGGGSEQASGGAAAILVGGPGGGSSSTEVDPAEPDRLPGIIPACPDVVRTWDGNLHDGDFETVIEETAAEIEGDPETRTLALLYNSLGRLYSSEEPAQVLADLDRAAGDGGGLLFCGPRGPVLHAEASMFANAALGDFVEAERDLTVVEQLAPEAASQLQTQLDQLQEVVESPSAPTDSPTPATPTPSPSPTPSPTS